MFQWDKSRWAKLVKQLGARAYDPIEEFKFAVEEQRARDPDWFRTFSGYPKQATSSLEGDFERPRHPTGRLKELIEIMRMIGPPSVGMAAAPAPTLVPGGAMKHFNVQPNTTIHVYGGGQDVGRYVYDAQARLASDLVRNLTASTL